MANQETAYGLRPIGMVGSGSNSTGITEYELANNDTSVIFNGEIVVPLATGFIGQAGDTAGGTCLLYTSPSPRDRQKSRMPSSA